MNSAVLSAIVFCQAAINLGLWLKIRLLTKSTDDQLNLIADHIDKRCVKRGAERPIR